LEEKLNVNPAKEIGEGGGIAKIPLCPPKASCQKLETIVITISAKAKVTIKKAKPFSLEAGNPIRKEKSAAISPEMGRATQKETPIFITRRAEL
jgi:hypothetical protein